MSKIISLETQNVKRLSAVSINPDGTIVVIGGKNGAGKSSVLDSMLYALSGSKSFPDKPVREGEKTALIKVVIDSEPPMIVERRITKAGKTTLSIKQDTPNGFSRTLSSPQRILDAMCGKIAFDPLSFTRLRPQEQAKLLREVVGVDFTELDARHDETFRVRAEGNVELKRFKATAEGLPHDPKAPKEPLDTATLMANLSEIGKQNQSYAEAERDLATNASHLDTAEQNLGNLRARLIEAEAVELQIKLALELSREYLASISITDDTELREQITNADAINNAVRINAQLADVLDSVKHLEAASEEKTQELTAIKDEKIAAMAAADWPVDGLGFGDDGITFNDLPFEQCSSAEQLRISTAIGLSQNPELKVMMIRDGSLLDESSLAMIGEIAEEAGAQIWIERVGDGEECSVIIEDGQVLETRRANKVQEVDF